MIDRYGNGDVDILCRLKPTDSNYATEGRRT